MIWQLEFNEQDQSVLTLDLQARQRRLAMAGLSGIIKIFDASPIIDNILNWRQSNSQNIIQHDISYQALFICECHKHSQAVNCLRWNSVGSFFISAGDDQNICLWRRFHRNCQDNPSNIGKEQDEQQNYEQQNGEKDDTPQHSNTQQWLPMRSWTQHSQAVISVSWCPDDLHFASCSVDSNVFIWNINFGLIQRLPFMGGWGCGLTWDPCNRYLVCQTDTNSLIIWQNLNSNQGGKKSLSKHQSTSAPNFKLRQVMENDQKNRVDQLNETFSQNNQNQENNNVKAGNFMYRKLDFSPEGLYTIIPNSIKDFKPTAKLVKRDTFQVMFQLQGHLGNIYAARFHKNMFNTQDKVPKALLAIADSDGALSLWIPGMPPFVIEQLFTSVVIDLSWDLNQKILIAASLSGQVAVIDFDEVLQKMV